MAKLTAYRFEVIIDQTAKLADKGPELCKAAVYAGAKVMADAYRREISALHTVSEKKQMAAWHKMEPTYLSVKQKIGLLNSLGVTPIKSRNGVYNAKVGFDGYNAIITKSWPHGQPNMLVARSCESGSSAMLKQPFARRANGDRKMAEEAMADAVNKEIEKITGGK